MGGVAHTVGLHLQHMEYLILQNRKDGMGRLFFLPTAKPSIEHNRLWKYSLFTKYACTMEIQISSSSFAIDLISHGGTTWVD